MDRSLWHVTRMQVLAARQRRELAKAAAWFLFRIRAGMKRQNFTNIPYDNTYLIYVGDNVLQQSPLRIITYKDYLPTYISLLPTWLIGDNNYDILDRDYNIWLIGDYYIGMFYGTKIYQQWISWGIYISGIQPTHIWCEYIYIL